MSRGPSHRPTELKNCSMLRHPSLPSNGLSSQVPRGFAATAWEPWQRRLLAATAQSRFDRVGPLTLSTAAAAACLAAAAGPGRPRQARPIKPGRSTRLSCVVRSAAWRDWAEQLGIEAHKAGSCWELGRFMLLGSCADHGAWRWSSLL